MKRIISGLLPFCGLMALNASADNHTDWRTWPMGDRAGLSVGAFFANLDSKVGIGTTDTGAIIDFESDLGLEDTKTRPLISGFWRISKRNKLSIEYFKLDRSADTTTDGEISIGGITIPDQTDVSAFFDIEAITINYSFSFIKKERHDLYAGLGLSWQNYKIGIKNQDNQESLAFKAAAPLPSIILGYDFAFNEKWVWKNKIGGLVVKLDLDDDSSFSGNVYDLSTGIEWRAFRYASLGLSLDYFHVDVDVTDKPSDITAAIGYDYIGPKLFVSARF